MVTRVRSANEQRCGSVKIVAEAAMLAAFQASHDVAISAMQSRLDKFGPCFESRIQCIGTGFSVGKRLTFADVVLGSALNDYLEPIPICLDIYPQLQKLHSRIVQLPGIQRYLNSDERYPTPGEDYVIGVARTLQRALPAHMPDANRFVV